ncbi:MAG: acylase [Ketobacter sp.]|nr:MAG: acylase [Ketobacter sp.]
MVAFDDDGVLNAKIRRTDYGVPHIKADNLESLAFGIGYAFSEDNACMLLDIVARYNSRRSQFYGPDKIPGSGDSANLITDFSYLALGIREQAEAGYDTLSENTQAMLSGYSKGFNYYLAQTGSDNLDPQCAGKPWVQNIDHLDMLTALLGTALLPGSGNFLAPLFLATPPGTSYLPAPAATSAANQPARTIPERNVSALKQLATLPQLPGNNPRELGSNAWAIGKDLSANGRGLLLANPHFPHTGILRFWQFHSTIPGVMDVLGSSLYGTPGMVNIGFNKHLAWSHTYSTAEHFIVYELALAESDPSGMTYLVDEEPRTIQEKTLTLNVAVGANAVMPFTKKVYYSDFGPMIAAPDVLPWGENQQGRFVAYSIKDVNQQNFDIVDHWMAMNLAGDMEELKDSFKQFDGVLFNNTLAVDRAGNTFYIDDSTVPNLSPIAEQALRTDPALVQARELLGFSLLPGTSAVFDFNGPVPYENAPKLERSDFVQNSNDSYWLTNPADKLTGYSILYGKTDAPQSLRSRMSQKMLEDSKGPDERFDLDDLQRALFSERSYLAEAVLSDLVALCEAQGEIPVEVDITEEEVTEEGVTNTVAVNIAPACSRLGQWDGRFKKDSRGAHVFREFAQQFATDPQWVNPFDGNDPTNTPNTLDANATVLQQLAKAVLVLEEAGVALDATLGDVQFVEYPNLDGTPSGEKLPWEGGNNIEGGFNVYRSIADDSSLLPRHIYPPIPGSQISAAGKGYQVSQGSSWIMLVTFTEHGPEARGLMTYSQSTDPTSVHRDDQTRLYSEAPQLRPIFFREKAIKAHTISEVKLEYSLP